MLRAHQDEQIDQGSWSCADDHFSDVRVHAWRSLQLLRTRYGGGIVIGHSFKSLYTKTYTLVVITSLQKHEEKKTVQWFVRDSSFILFYRKKKYMTKRLTDDNHLDIGSKSTNEDPKSISKNETLAYIGYSFLVFIEMGVNFLPICMFSLIACTCMVMSFLMKSRSTSLRFATYIQFCASANPSFDTTRYSMPLESQGFLCTQCSGDIPDQGS